MAACPQASDKHCVLRADGGVAADFGKRSQGTEVNPVGGPRCHAATATFRIFTRRAGVIDAILHAIEQVDAPGFDDSAVFHLRKSGSRR